MRFYRVLAKCLVAAAVWIGSTGCGERREDAGQAQVMQRIAALDEELARARATDKAELLAAVQRIEEDMAKFDARRVPEGGTRTDSDRDGRRRMARFAVAAALENRQSFASLPLDLQVEFVDATSWTSEDLIAVRDVSATLSRIDRAVEYWREKPQDDETLRNYAFTYGLKSRLDAQAGKATEALRSGSPTDARAILTTFSDYERIALEEVKQLSDKARARK